MRDENVEPINIEQPKELKLSKCYDIRKPLNTQQTGEHPGLNTKTNLRVYEWRNKTLGRNKEEMVDQ